LRIINIYQMIVNQNQQVFLNFKLLPDRYIRRCRFHKPQLATIAVDEASVLAKSIEQAARWLGSQAL